MALLYIKEISYQPALASTFMAQLITSCQFARFLYLLSIKAQIKHFNLSQNYQIMRFLLEAVVITNIFKIACKYSTCADKFIISSNWYQVTIWIFFQMSSMKIQDSFKLCQKKVLNLSHVMKTIILTLKFDLYCCHYNKADS